MEKSNSILIVLSGPSGVGKDAVLNHMKNNHMDYHFTVTVTTREKRPNETEGIDYIFIEKPKFESLRENDDLLESAEVYGNFYGIPKSQVLDALSSGKDVIMKLDVQGAKTIKSLAPNALFIFLAAPTIESLRTRLEKRMTESPEALETRLNTAKMENTESEWFDHIIINEDDQIDKTVKELEEIIFKARNISRGPIFN
ncbi:MAG: guanylate kinase [Chloroflexi bacterium]|nr:guanylate kinase [Chloroflexota bacterium]|tara:strand:+ start:12875 stop:13471 length:597 start_codon:yes stop_codon:yes gene_type:complete